MKLVLKSFAQEVSLEHKDQVKYFVYFTDEETGLTLKLPVPKETSEAIIAFAWGRDPETEKTSSPEPEPRAEDTSDAVEFGGEEVPEDEPTQDVENDEDDSGPSSEEEVPSL